MKEKESIDRKNKIYKVTLWGCVVNIFLAIIKVIAGIIGRSGAMLADAIHSLSDLASDIVVLLFVKLASKPKDANHSYGHGKYETLATTIIGLTLGLIGCGILYDSICRIYRATNGEILAQPRMIALIVAIISVIAKEVLYRKTLKTGRIVGSSVLIANAWHHRTDALSSIGTLLGVGCAYFMGERWRIADPIGAIFVSALIFKVAYDLMKVGIDELLESSLPEEDQIEIIKIISKNKAVKAPHNLCTRRIGNSVAIEVNICVDGTMTVNESHLLTVEIEENLKQKYGQDCSVGIHVEPYK